jgi:seryl-tRNA synthetase
LTENANRNNQAILDKLASMETRALQDKLDAVREKNSQLSGEISQLNQNQYIAGVVGQSMAPLNAQLAALNKEVDDIKCKLPNTVNVEYPNLVAVNATPYVNGGFYGNSGYNYYGGNGFGGGIVF